MTSGHPKGPQLLTPFHRKKFLSKNSPSFCKTKSITHCLPCTSSYSLTTGISVHRLSRVTCTNGTPNTRTFVVFSNKANVCTSSLLSSSPRLCPLRTALICSPYLGGGTSPCLSQTASGSSVFSRDLRDFSRGSLCPQLNTNQISFVNTQLHHFRCHTYVFPNNLPVSAPSVATRRYTG